MILREPQVDIRSEQHYVGIRFQTQFKGMGKILEKKFKELNTWVKEHGITPAGPPFQRFHVIDMEGEMDLEVGIPVATPIEDDGQVQPGVIPAGRYASLVYNGSGYTGNKVLVEWARDNGLQWDRWDDPKGDSFRSRYESYLTDPKTEHRKTKWDIEVAIKLADE